MPTLADRHNCTGCTACDSVCPKSAITMVADGMGFKFPEVNPALCIECKLCEKACPIIKPLSVDVRTPEPKSVALQLKNESELAKSQSGGAFYAVASEALKSGFIVYGAGFDNELNVRHMSARNLDELDNLRFSKYVQSDLGETFKQIARQLKEGQKVLFSGTPCQIAGLKGAIPAKSQGNLLTVDLICHGVPGPEVYRKYLRYLEHRYDHKVEKFIFRDKDSFGWSTPRESAIFDNGVKKSFYYYNFLFQEKDLIAREACGRCRFCTLTRVADLTIADCWGWEKLGRKDFDENRGISLMLVNTPKGYETLQAISSKIDIVDVPLRPHLLQRNLQRPTRRPALADKVAADFAAHGFRYINRRYGLNSPRAIAERVRRYVGKVYRDMISRI